MGFRRWMCAIARHRVCDVVRYYNNQKRAAKREEACPRLPDDSAFCYNRSASDSVARREHVAKVVEALDDLNPSEREVIIRLILEGCPRPEVAEMMGRTPDGVSVMLHRALAKLGRILRQRGLATTILRAR